MFVNVVAVDLESHPKALERLPLNSGYHLADQPAEAGRAPSLSAECHLEEHGLDIVLNDARREGRL